MYGTTEVVDSKLDAKVFTTGGTHSSIALYLKLRIDILLHLLRGKVTVVEGYTSS